MAGKLGYTRTLVFVLINLTCRDFPSQQVLCNSLPALVAATLWAVLYSHDSLQSKLLRDLLPESIIVLGRPYKTAIQWPGCPLDATVGYGWSRSLSLAVLG